MALTQDVYMALILSLLSGMRHRGAAEALTGERSPFLGLHKEPECANPQHSNTAVLDWHPGMLSAWCQDPPFHLTIFYSHCWEGRGISGNKSNPATLRKK